MSEQKEYCPRCHGTGRVGYVTTSGQRGRYNCPDCLGTGEAVVVTDFARSAAPPIDQNRRLGVPKVTSGPANAPAPSNAQQTPSWERSRPGFLWGNPVPFPTARPKEWFKMAEDLLNQTEDEYHRDREFEEGWAAWL